MNIFLTNNKSKLVCASKVFATNFCALKGKYKKTKSNDITFGISSESRQEILKKSERNKFLKRATNKKTKKQTAFRWPFES